MDRYADFRVSYQRWASWIGFDKDKTHKNTLWHQCTEMMNNEFTFQALFLARSKASNQPDYLSYLAANDTLYRYLLDGYLSFQYLAIRRMTDVYNFASDKKNVKGVASLSRLLTDMQNHSHLMTREAFVCVDGLPYEYEALLIQEQAEDRERLMKERNSVSRGEKGIGAQSAHRHYMFDKLSGVQDEKDRKPGDMVSEHYWREYQEVLEDSDLRHIKNFADKYLAHAADKQSQDTLSEEDRRLSIERIHKAQHILTRLLQKLTLDFYHRKYAMIPLYNAEQLVHNFSRPFVPEAVSKEVYDNIRTLIDKQLSAL